MDRLLARIRSALQGAARRPEPGPGEPSGAEVNADLVVAFREALRAASGRLVVVDDEAAARAFVASEWPNASGVDVGEHPPEAKVREAMVGIDRATLLIAETGTVVRTYATREDARVALVPPVSVFLARTQDLVRDLPTALARVGDAHRAGRAYSVLVTGPSRTADIEKQLVIPAHGPREVVVLLVGP